jgi:hypothetical protein
MSPKKSWSTPSVTEVTDPVEIAAIISRLPEAWRWEHTPPAEEELTHDYTPRPANRDGRSRLMARSAALRSYAVTRIVPFKLTKGGPRPEQVQGGGTVRSWWGPGGFVGGFFKPNGMLDPVVYRLVPCSKPARPRVLPPVEDTKAVASNKRGPKSIHGRRMTKKEQRARLKALREGRSFSLDSKKGKPE